MGTLGWTVDQAARLVTVRGVGVYDLSFAMALGAAMWSEGAVGYCKLLDLSQSDIRLSSDDLQVMVANTCLAGATTAGPIAVVLGPEPDPLLLDMAVLIKSRIGNRRRFQCSPMSGRRGGGSLPKPGSCTCRARSPASRPRPRRTAPSPAETRPGQTDLL